MKPWTEFGVAPAESDCTGNHIVRLRLDEWFSLPSGIGGQRQGNGIFFFEMTR